MFQEMQFYNTSAFIQKANSEPWLVQHPVGLTRAASSFKQSVTLG